MKRSYTAPVLTRFGSLDSITQGAGAKISADKSSGYVVR